MAQEALVTGDASPTTAHRPPQDHLRRMERRDYYDGIAAAREGWKRRHRYYHAQIARWCRQTVPSGAAVLDVGCGSGDLLAALQPSRGVGLDWSPAMIAQARAKYPALEFVVDDVEQLTYRGAPFDYVIMSDVLGTLDDVQRAFAELQPLLHARSRVLITYYNLLWEPILRLGEWLGLKQRQPVQNWLPLDDIENLLTLAGYEVVSHGHRLLLPVYVPLLSTLCNRVLGQLPGLRRLSLVQTVVARPRRAVALAETLTCSVIVPCRNERGMIEDAVRRTPTLGARTELIFVEGHSTDGTAEEIERVIRAHPERDIRLIAQGDGRGKGDAVRRGFAAARGDVLMILDADLTTPPEDLPKFVQALADGQGEFINGSRLVYPMEQQAMRFLNYLGNQAFSAIFTYLLEQRFRDTLCGTKVLLRRDYERLAANRSYFGEFDPFGDFDLLFGAAKLQLKIVEIPIRYRSRVYGTTNIQRFRHGLLLARMCLVAMGKLKFL